MPRNQPLTIKEIDAAKANPEKDYKMADGEGMYQKSSEVQPGT